MHIHDSTYACGAADAGAAVLTKNLDMLRLVCKERNAHMHCGTVVNVHRIQTQKTKN